MSENPEELIPLTPSMFLISNKNSYIEDIEELNSNSLNKRIKYRSKLLKDLRQRFRNEYLSQLIQKHNEKESRDPQIGEVVLVADDNKKRLFWALAKIIELIPGRDGKIRMVRLKTQHGKILRPKQRIYPLEIRSNENLQRGLEESIPTVSETLSPDEKAWSCKSSANKIKNFMDNPDEKNKTHLESKLTMKSLRIKLSDIREEYYEVVADDSDLEPLESEILDLENDYEAVLINWFYAKVRGIVQIVQSGTIHFCVEISRERWIAKGVQVEKLPNMEPGITPTLNVNSECFQPKKTIPSCVESFENGGEFVGHSKGHSTMLLSSTVAYCQNSRGEVFPLRCPTGFRESNYCGLVTNANELNHSIKSFWEIENCPDFEIPTMSIEDKLCEEHFTNTYNRDETGRFIVKMPLPKDPSCLRDSKQMALRRLNSLWRRLVQDPRILELYINCIHVYLEMGHLEEVEDEDSAIVYYLPPHGVYRQESKTTPLRVAFNASSITTSGGNR
ncbi:integrase catalytic domain-containing protein [Trichonephila clavipes]|nr:integrase catalytic domain-containing protein [Trichonephila clavipes]